MSWNSIGDYGQPRFPYYFNTLEHQMYSDNPNGELEGNEYGSDAASSDFYGCDETDRPPPVLGLLSSDMTVAHTAQPVSAPNSETISGSAANAKSSKTAPTMAKIESISAKEVNEQRLAELRARLIANRLSTPAKDGFNVASLETKAVIPTATSGHIKTNNQLVSTPADNVSKKDQVQDAVRTQPNPPKTLSSDALDIHRASSAIDDLLAEGQAAASAQQQIQQEKRKVSLAPETAIDRSTTKPDVVQPQKGDYKELNKRLALASASQDSHSSPKVTQNTAKTAEAKDTTKLSDLKCHRTSYNGDASATLTQPINHVEEPYLITDAIGMHDNNEGDAELWLRMTGFYDEPFRVSRLKTYKLRIQLERKRKALEADFAELERQEAVAAHDPNAAKYLRSRSTISTPALNQRASIEGEDTKPVIIKPITESITNSATNPVVKPASRPNQPARIADSTTVGIKRPLSSSGFSTQEQPAPKSSRIGILEHSSRTDTSKTAPNFANSKGGPLKQRQEPSMDRIGYRIYGAGEKNIDKKSFKASKYLRSPSPLGAGSMARRVSHPSSRSDRRGPQDDDFPFEWGYKPDNHRGRASSPRGYSSQRSNQSHAPYRGTYSKHRGGGFGPR